MSFADMSVPLLEPRAGSGSARRTARGLKQIADDHLVACLQVARIDGGEVTVGNAELDFHLLRLAALVEDPDGRARVLLASRGAYRRRVRFQVQRMEAQRG